MATDLVTLGSQTARNGFANEGFVRDEFNNWETSELAQAWLMEMDYKISEIEYVRAEKLSGHKTDVQVSVMVVIKLKRLTDIQNLQVKLVSNPKGFNQIDKRWIDRYVGLWNIPPNITRLLKLYTGEMLPYKSQTRDSRRMFITEFSLQEQSDLLQFIRENKILIISDIIKGRGEFHAEWMLVILKSNEHSLDWILKPINLVMNHFGNGNVVITRDGNIKIGNITMQRKGGDNGRETAKMLQFKINPAELFDV
jgi:hypothetical protein